jgi:hypothetical protein
MSEQTGSQRNTTPRSQIGGDLSFEDVLTEARADLETCPDPDCRAVTVRRIVLERLVEAVEALYLEVDELCLELDALQTETR